MSTWLPIAILGHLLNACAFLVDKALLSTAFRKSGTYATLIGVLSCFVFLAAPWTTIPSADAWPSVAGFGALFVLAVWTFFEALRRAEATRVVPIIGSLVPIFTLIGTSIFLGERLSTNGYIGFGFLVVATGILASGRGKGRLSTGTIGVCVLSAVLFAASSTLGKHAFASTGFLDVFVWSRLATLVVAVGIGLLASGVKDELKKLIFVKSKGAAVKESFALGLMFFGQTCGAFGFLFVQYAVSQGSASIVNALQAVQYAALVMVAWFGGERLAGLLHERRSISSYLAKGIAIVLVAIGLYFVTYGA